MSGSAPAAIARRTGWVFAGWAAGLALLVVGQPLFTGRAYSQADILFDYAPWSAHRPSGFLRPGNTLLGDVPMIFYPGLAHARRAVREGRVPAWNPHIYGGQPFIGATQTAVFSPVTAIAYAVPLPDALTWVYLARLALGGTGMFVLLGAAGLGPAARVFGGVAWLLAPFVIVWLEYPVGEAAAWLPWQLWATWRVCGSPAWRDIALLAVVTALALFAGHPETTAKALLLCGLLAPTFAWSQAPPASRRHRQLVPGLVRAGVGVGLGVALAAIQVLPSLEYLEVSRILAAREAAAANVYVVPPETAVTAVVPNFLGHPASATYLPMQNRYGLPSNYAEQQVYAGVVVWLLAAVGAWSRRRQPLALALAASAVVAVLLMYGAPGVTALVAHVPGLSVLVLSRFGLLVGLSAVWLASHGVEALIDRPRDTSLVPAFVTAAGMGSLVLASAVFFHRVLVAHEHWATSLGWVAWAMALAVVALGIMALRIRGALGGRAFGTAATVLLSLDLTVFAWGFHPSVERSQVFPRVTEIAAVTRDTGLFRVIGWGHALVPNTAMMYGLSDVRGYDGIAPAAWSELLDTAMPSGLHHELTGARAFPLLDLLNVRYVFAEPGVDFPPDRFMRVTGGPAAVWRNERAFPRAFLVSRFVVAPGRAEALALMRDGALDLRHVAVLEAPPPGMPANPPAPPDEEGSADIRRYEDDHIEIVSTAPGPRVLVLSDAYFPGWTVSVDARPAPLLRADHALRAVAVPEGRHVVRLTYRPGSLRVGGAVSGAALVLLVLGVVPGSWSAWRNRRARRG